MIRLHPWQTYGGVLTPSNNHLRQVKGRKQCLPFTVMTPLRIQNSFTMVEIIPMATQPPAYSRRAQGINDDPPAYARHEDRQDSIPAVQEIHTNTGAHTPQNLPPRINPRKRLSGTKLCLYFITIAIPLVVLIALPIKLLPRPSDPNQQASTSSAPLPATAMPDITRTTSFVPTTTLQSTLMPIASTSFDLPDLPLGIYSVTLSRPTDADLNISRESLSITSSSCEPDAFIGNGIGSSWSRTWDTKWGCSADVVAYNVSIAILGGKYPQISLVPLLSFAEYTLSASTEYDDSILDSFPPYLAPEFPPAVEGLPLTLAMPVGTLPSSSNGEIGYHFQTTYDKFIVVPPQSYDLPGIAVTSNSFWFCYWNQTLLEGTVYVQQRISSQFEGDLPVRIDLREGRLPYNHASPYCRLVNVYDAGGGGSHSYKPVLDQEGNSVVKLVNETDGETIFRMSGDQNDRAGCACNWTQEGLSGGPRDLLYQNWGAAHRARSCVCEVARRHTYFLRQHRSTTSIMAPKAPEPFIMPGKEAAFTKAVSGGGAKTSPVHSNTDDLARLYTHIHPVLVLAIFYARFSATVADPVSSLLTLLPVLTLLQCIYCAICLPTSSATSAPEPAKTTPAKRKPGRKTSPSRSSPANLLSKVFPAILSALLALTVGAPLLTAFLVLHGAPVTTHIPHTALAGAHFALLATLPLFYSHGVSAPRWRALAGLAAPVDEVFGAALGACVGAWLGAVPIPLDWDREWQKWPVTIVAGMYGGWAVGKLVGGTVGFGRDISFDD
ncbi:hypothetical protein FH972_021708 [Carpinus fangiana]|uniref:Glycosylphosphatidylinositol anchor biosynthesis protein 11 n=1 Tax=Carpinus fangiana TaxID=176857 RepID=A0A5N6KQN8_9ROSI|nr:hypothetical protein FH972_021708 [Carpinus fangiana]